MNTNDDPTKDESLNKIKSDIDSIEKAVGAIKSWITFFGIMTVLGMLVILIRGCAGIF